MSPQPTRARVFLISTRGLEDLVAEEFAERAAGAISAVGYRRVAGEADPAALASLRLPDDAFLDLAAWEQVSHTRAALADIAARAAELPLTEALARLRALRDLPARPRLAIAVSHVGARNYSAPEVRASCAAALGRHVELVERDDDAQASLRLFLEHGRAWVGLRITRAPLHERPWRQHRPGALRASVAAALARWAHRASASAARARTMAGGSLLRRRRHPRRGGAPGPRGAGRGRGCRGAGGRGTRGGGGARSRRASARGASRSGAATPPACRWRPRACVRWRATCPGIARCARG